MLNVQIYLFILGLQIKSKIIENLMHRSIYLFETILGNILILFTVQIENDTKCKRKRIPKTI